MGQYLRPEIWQYLAKYLTIALLGICAKGDMPKIQILLIEKLLVAAKCHMQDRSW